MSTRTQISKISGNKPRKADYVEQDLISNLPDCIISHILSRLPTKYAVRTSVLSKDWEFKWTSIYNVQVCDEVGLKNGSKKANFVDFVEKTLFLSQNLQSFSYKSIREYDLRRWIPAALSHNVHCLRIECPSGESLVLPLNLFSCYSLRKLYLAIPCTFKVSEKACFQNLTSLDLIIVRILNEQSISDRVEFNFPLLEKLDIVQCQWLNIKFVDIYAPKMTDLSLLNASDGFDDCSFKITGDSPLKFSFYEETDQTNTDLSGSDVVHAELKTDFAGDNPFLREQRGSRFRKLLTELSSTLKGLEICGDLAEAIAQSKLGHSLPKYYKMERLSLWPHFGNTELLLELLHAAPHLKLLDIDVAGLKDYGYDYDAEESIPSCIVSHLEKLTLFSYTGVNIQGIELVKFFMKNAVQLKSLCVHPPWHPSPMREEERHEIAEELRTYPKASACLTISVEGAIPRED